MKRIERFLVGVAVLASMLAGGRMAFALTAQDKLDASITDEGLSKSIETGTRLNETASTLTLNGSTSLMTVYTVPTGKKAHITRVAYLYSGTTTNVRVTLLANGKSVDQDAQPTTNEVNAFVVDVWLNAGETIQLNAVGYTLNDDLYGYVYGLEYTSS